LSAQLIRIDQLNFLVRKWQHLLGTHFNNIKILMIKKEIKFKLLKLLVKVQQIIQQIICPQVNFLMAYFKDQTYHKKEDHQPLKYHLIKIAATNLFMIFH